MALKVPNLDSITANPMFTPIGEALSAISTAVDNMGQKLAVNPQGSTLAPAPPSAINVTANASGIHRVSIVDNNPRTRQVHYFIEHSISRNFRDADTQTEHLGVARQRSLPQSMGKTPVYYRAYSMYPDGQRSQMVYFGSATNPTGVVDGATTTGPAFHPSTGSGTSTGAGYGFGQEHFVPNPTTPGRAPKVY